MKKIFSLILVGIFSFSSIFTPVNASAGKNMFWKKRTLDFDASYERPIQELHTNMVVFAPIALGMSFLNTSPEILSIVAGVAVLGGAVTAVSTRSYLFRSRDTGRMGGLNNVALALNVYIIDMGEFPKVPQNGCIPEKELLGEGSHAYIKKIPTDPIKWRMNYGCLDSSGENSYAYRLISGENDQKIAILSATMENIQNGNSPYSIDQIVKIPRLLEKVENWEFKGKWKYYIISVR